MDRRELFTLARAVYLIRDAASSDQTRLRVNAVGLSFALSSGIGLRLDLSAHAALLTPANQAKGIAADATLPHDWTGSLGMPDGTSAKLAFSVPQTSPCLELEVGSPPAANGRATAIAPMLRLGALSAGYAQIVVAPTGCSIGSPAPGGHGYQIDPGFALGFDGEIGSAPVSFSQRCD